MSYLSNQIYYNGCKKKVEVPHITPELEELCTFIKKDVLTEDVHVPSMHKKTSLRLGRQFYTRYFKVHDIWTMDYKVMSELAKRGPITIGELLEAEKKIEKYISPFDLKVVFTNKLDLFDGLLKAKSYYKDTGVIVRPFPAFTKIDLSSKVTLASPTVYVHELAHSQLQSNLGSVRYYKNTEMIPLFLQLVCANAMTDNEYVLRIMEKFFCSQIGKHYLELCGHESGLYPATKDELVITGKYLNSLIAALNMYIMYYNGSIETKRHILREIQKVFDGHQDLEEFTKRDGITGDIDNRVLQKHLTR